MRKFGDDLESEVGFDQYQYEHAVLTGKVDPILMHLQMHYFKMKCKMNYMDHHGIMVVVESENGQRGTSHVTMNPNEFDTNCIYPRDQLNNVDQGIWRRRLY